MPAWMILPALAAGNTVIFKPSEETPLSGQAYADVLNEKLPRDVLIVVHGADDQGKQLVDSDVDLIAFTGSRSTASTRVMACAQHFVEQSLVPRQERCSHRPIDVRLGVYRPNFRD